MKAFTKIVLVAALLLTAGSAAAQYKFYYPELYVGTNQGVALWTTVGFSPEVAQNFDVRYHGGVTVRYIIQKYFGIQAELNYTQRGWSETSAAGQRYDHRFDYLELPLVSHIFFGKNFFKFYINLGPKIRYMVYDQASAPFSDGSGGIQQEMKIQNRFDYSVFGGIGFEFRTKKAGSFFLEARYDYGLGNVFAATKADAFQRSNNQAITISVGYLYNVLTKKKKEYEKF